MFKHEESEIVFEKIKKDFDNFKKNAVNQLTNTTPDEVIENLSEQYFRTSVPYIKKGDVFLTEETLSSAFFEVSPADVEFKLLQRQIAYLEGKKDFIRWEIND